MHNGYICKKEMGLKSMDLSQYQYIVGYGIGQYYDYIKNRLSRDVHFDYLCDAKWEQIGRVYDGGEVISPERLKSMEGVFVVVFSGNARNWKSITAMLDDMGLPYIHADRMTSVRNTITGKELKTRGAPI